MCVLIFEKWFQYLSLIISWGSSKLVWFFPPCINSSYGLQGWYIMVDVAKATAVELGCTIFVFAVSWLNNIFTIKIHEIKSARMLILCRILPNLASVKSVYNGIVGLKILKSPGQKKLVKPNKSISRKNFFDQIPFFVISKMAKNQFLNWEKV